MGRRVHNESGSGRHSNPLFCKTTMVRPSFGSHTRPRAGEGGRRKFKAEKEKIGPQETRANRRARVVEGALAHEKPWIAAWRRTWRTYPSVAVSVDIAVYLPTMRPRIIPGTMGTSWHQVSISSGTHGPDGMGTWACIRAKGCISPGMKFLCHFPAGGSIINQPHTRHSHGQGTGEK